MSDAITQTAPSAPKPPPVVKLRDYYLGTLKLDALLKSTSSPDDLNTEDQRAGLITELGMLDPDLARSANLAAHLGQGRRRPDWLAPWVRAVVAREHGAMLDAQEHSSGLGLRRLFNRAQDALRQKRPAVRRRGYNALRLSLLAVAIEQPIDASDLTDEAIRLCYSETRAARGRDLEREATQPIIAAATYMALKKLLNPIRYWFERGRTDRSAAAGARADAERTLGANRELQSRIDSLGEDIENLKATVARLEVHVSALQGDLTSSENKRLNDVRQLKDRIGRLLESDVEPWLKSAHDALTGGAPVIKVAIERLDTVIERVKKEAAWLSSD